MNWLNNLALIRLLILVIYLKEADYNKKIEDTEKKVSNHDKYITTNDFNNFLGAVFNERLKQIKIATNNYFKIVEQSSIKHEGKIEKLQTFDLSFLLDKFF